MNSPGIPGEFYAMVGGEKRVICRSIERPWLGNKRSVSCIPEGQYPLQRRKFGRYWTIYSQRWRHDFVMEVGEVPKRTAILIHAGRGIVDSQGCILTTDVHRIKVGRLTAAGTSRDAYCALYTAVRMLDLQRLVITSGAPQPQKGMTVGEFERKMERKLNDGKTKKRRA